MSRKVLPPIVYAGPSIRETEILEICPGAEVRPPIRRGDLGRDRDAGHSVFLILDGVFMHHLPVSPREIAELLEEGGVTLAGASSMGALRAAECWPLGMLGMGCIYRLFRRGVLQSDDEVAVTTDATDGHRALSVALINLRYGLRKAVRAGLLSLAQALEAIHQVESIYFPDRTWASIARATGLSPEIIALCSAPENDLKRKDALHAVRRLRPLMLRLASSADGRSERTPTRVAFARYGGHAPLCGHREATLKPELLRWIFGSGRYQRYVWPLLLGEPGLDGLTGTPAERAAERRQLLAAFLADRLATRLDELADQLFSELEFLAELDSEVMRYHAVLVARDRVRREGTAPPDRYQRLARETVSIAHGCVNWEELLGCCDEGRLWGAIPLEWVEESCELVAAAKLVRSQRPVV